MIIDGVQITTHIIDGIQTTTHGFNFDTQPPDYDELKNYVDYCKARVPNVTSINVVLCDNGEVDLKYIAHDVKFERIRRITGYLVGTTDRWNDAKQAEEKDRVKHDTKL